MATSSSTLPKASARASRMIFRPFCRANQHQLKHALGATVVDVFDVVELSSCWRRHLVNSVELKAAVRVVGFMTTVRDQRRNRLRARSASSSSSSSCGACRVCGAWCERHKSRVNTLWQWCERFSAGWPMEKYACPSYLVCSRVCVWAKRVRACCYYYVNSGASAMRCRARGTQPRRARRESSSDDGTHSQHVFDGGVVQRWTNVLPLCRRRRRTLRVTRTQSATCSGVTSSTTSTKRQRGANTAQRLPPNDRPNEKRVRVGEDQHESERFRIA